MRRIHEGSGNVDDTGNFSIQVLRAALQNDFNLSLPSLAQQGVQDHMDVTEMEGFICNRHDHWFAIRKINNRFWNLNSTMEKPEQISHFQLAITIRNLQDKGYSVFCVAYGLPPPCKTIANQSRGQREFWWKESALLGRSKNGNGSYHRAAWDNVGSGMRIDGKATGNVVDLTEDEQVAIALSESLAASSSQEVSQEVVVPEEPPQGAAGVERIQFRLPNGKRDVRRFDGSDSVAVLFSYARKFVEGQNMELRYGFPTKNLSEVKHKTIKEAQLGGESIHVIQA